VLPSVTGISSTEPQPGLDGRVLGVGVLAADDPEDGKLHGQRHGRHGVTVAAANLSSMRGLGAELAGHPDRLRWNARYGGDYAPEFRPHPLAVEALRLVPAGPVLELAAGPSGSALLAAADGHPVTVVDISDTGLGLLDAEAARRGLAGRLTLVQADLATWAAGPGRYSLVLCTNFWERAVFGAALAAVEDGGALAWESLTEAARAGRPNLPAQWCVRPGEPASLLPATPDRPLRPARPQPALPGLGVIGFGCDLVEAAERGRDHDRAEGLLADDLRVRPVGPRHAIARADPRHFISA
jgi:Methyltransferase domain